MLYLPDFLKKYSTIPNKFIDDFFTLYDYKTNDNDLIINFDNLCKWLNCRKDVLKKTLETSYIKNVDYSIKIIKLQSKGRPSEKIIITPDCMKRICMRSSTSKAEEVRTYFIKIEKLIDKYKQVIIDDLNKKLNILENNQKPKVNIKKGVIYIVKTQKTVDDFFKVGRSKKFLSRLMSHNSIEADDIEILMLYETDNIIQVETCVKTALKTKQYRKRKEIYQVDLDTIKETIEKCDEIICRVKNKKKVKNKVSIIDNKKIKNLFMMFIEKNELSKKSSKKLSKKSSKKLSKKLSKKSSKKNK
jgi:phage anti-repressor protein